MEMEEAERRVLLGQSLMVLGCPGTGKTHYTQGLVEMLRAQGNKVDVISKTHCASSRAGGVTADHWVRQHVINGTSSADCLWVDEIGQLDCELIAAINRLTFTGISFLLSGDFAQFPPIGNNWRGTPVGEDAFLKSNLLHTMAGGKRLVLTECRRSDSGLKARLRRSRSRSTASRWCKGC